METWRRFEKGKNTPKKGGRAIGYDLYYDRVGEIEWQYGDTWGFTDAQGDDCLIAFWMPLPGPPPKDVIEAMSKELFGDY